MVRALHRCFQPGALDSGSSASLKDQPVDAAEAGYMKHPASGRSATPSVRKRNRWERPLGRSLVVAGAGHQAEAVVDPTTTDCRGVTVRVILAPPSSPQQGVATEFAKDLLRSKWLVEHHPA